MRRRTIGLILAVSAIPTVAGRADAAGVTAFAVPGSTAVGYGTPIVVTAPGAELEFFNGDNTAGHDLVAYDAFGSDDQPWCKENAPGPGRCPLFWSRTIPFGEVTLVHGMDQVVSGRAYTFYCTIHARDMKGTLIVV